MPSWTDTSKTLRQYNPMPHSVSQRLWTDNVHCTVCPGLCCLRVYVVSPLSLTAQTNCAQAADGIMRPILYLWIFPLLICLGIYDCEHISTHPQISCDPYLSVIGQLQYWRSLIGQTSCDPLSGDCCFSLLHLAPGVQITAKNIQINTIFDSWCAKWKLFLISLLCFGLE